MWLCFPRMPSAPSSASQPSSARTLLLLSHDWGPNADAIAHINQALARHLASFQVRKPHNDVIKMETFSALLAIYAGNSPVTGEFPAQKPVTQSFDVFFGLRLNKRLSKQSWSRWFETPSRPLWRHCNATMKSWHRDSSLYWPFVSGNHRWPKYEYAENAHESDNCSAFENHTLKIKATSSEPMS